MRKLLLTIGTLVLMAAAAQASTRSAYPQGEAHRAYRLESRAQATGALGPNYRASEAVRAFGRSGADTDPDPFIRMYLNFDPPNKS